MLQARTDAAMLRALHPGPLAAEQRLDPQGSVIGRDRLADILVHGPGVSRRHCRLFRDEHGNWQVRDLESTNGVFINGRRIERETMLRPGDVIGLGQARAADFEFISATDTLGDSEANSHVPRRLSVNGSGPWLIGRDLAHPVNLPADPLVSLDHARVLALPEGLFIEDLDSRNGTWVDGRRIRRARLTAQNSVMIGSSELGLQEPTDGPPAFIVNGCEQAGLGAQRLRLASQGTWAMRFSSVAGIKVLVGLGIRGWLERPALLVEALLLPLLLVLALLAVIPDQPALIAVMAVAIAAALAAAFQPSRLPLAGDHLQGNDILVVMLAGGFLIALIQSALTTALIHLLPFDSPELLPTAAALALPLVALSATALGLICGVVARTRPILALVLVCLALAGQTLGAFEVDSITSPGLLLQRLADLSAVYWGVILVQQLTEGAGPAGLARPLAFLTGQALLFLTIARVVLKRTC